MPDIQAEVREVWDRNAAFWDEHMGEQGNDFHRELVSPSAERLLALAPGETVLERPPSCGRRRPATRPQRSNRCGRSRAATRRGPAMPEGDLAEHDRAGAVARTAR